MSERTREDGFYGTAVGGQASGRGVTRLLEAVRSFVAGFVATPGRLLEFLRYLAVSVIALGVDLAAFWALIEINAVDAVVAGASGVMAGLVVHYTLSALFVFTGQAAGKSQGRLICEYVLTGIAGVMITAGVMFVAVNLVGLPALLAKGGAVAITFVAVYVMRASLVFQSKPAVASGFAVAAEQTGSR